MRAYRVERKVAAKGALKLNALPFREGEVVEVIVLPCAEKNGPTATSPLRGTVIEYREPTEPVAQDDWEALK